MNVAGELLCPRCETWKDADFCFYWNSSTNKFSSYCKECHKASTIASNLKRAKQEREYLEHYQQVREQAVDQILAQGHLGPPGAPHRPIEVDWSEIDRRIGPPPEDFGR